MESLGRLQGGLSKLFGKKGVVSFSFSVQTVAVLGRKPPGAPGGFRNIFHSSSVFFYQ